MFVDARARKLAGFECHRERSMLPEMRQKSGFDAATATKAFIAMKALVNWYLEEHG
jgi:hypothetical protein